MKRPFLMLAFSLVEVTIALGIVTVGVVIMIGLLPTGLGLARESSDEAMAVNILSSLSTEIAASSGLTNQSLLSGIPLTVVNSGTNYFDEHGRRIGGGTNGDARYKAQWSVRAADAAKDISQNVYLQVAWPAARLEPSGWVEAVIFLQDNVSTN